MIHAPSHRMFDKNLPPVKHACNAKRLTSPWQVNQVYQSEGIMQALPCEEIEKRFGKSSLGPRRTFAGLLTCFSKGPSAW